jgi:hypothetical protein
MNRNACQSGRISFSIYAQPKADHNEQRQQQATSIHTAQIPITQNNTAKYWSLRTSLQHNDSPAAHSQKRYQKEAIEQRFPQSKNRKIVE